jgi:hypothetical protein
VIDEAVHPLPRSATREAVTWVADRRELVAWWAGSRALVVAVALLGHVTRYPHGYFGRHAWAWRHALGILGAWDGIWYRRIAQHGYLLVPGRRSDPAFFPLWPVVLRVVHGFGISYVAAGILLANGCFLGAVLAVDALGRRWLPAADARRAAVLLAVFPLGTVFSMAYPESLVLLLITGATLAALDDRWLLAAACAGAAALARPEGVLVALPLLAIGWRRERRSAVIGAALAPVATLVSFPLYLGQVLHDPGAWGRAETAWGRSFRWDGVYRAFETVPAMLRHNAWLTRDVVFFVLYLALLTVAYRTGVSRGWIAAGAAMVLLPLASGSLMSDGRFGLLAIPVFWGLAVLTRDRRVERVVLGVSIVLLAGVTLTIPSLFP